MKKWTVFIIIAAITAVVLFFAPRFLPKETLEQSHFQKIQSSKVLELINQAKPKPTLVNLWASWCDPCREEIPFIIEFAQKYPNLNILFVSADNTDGLIEAQKVLTDLNVPPPHYVKDDTESEFITTLYPDWGGAIPVTLIYDKDGNLKKFWQGAATKEEFEKHIQDVL